MPESYYIRSDTIEQFMRLNRLGEWQNQKYKPIDQVESEYRIIKGVFRNGAFPVEITQQLRAILANLGNHPLIVRSSSLLEDRFGTAFSGKYASIFVANQGDLESRLRGLLGAIAEVYASILAPDPIMYRRQHHLIDYQEDMAVLIQKVVGRRIGPYFLPVCAGVAFSRNEYRWTPRIKREDGLMRLVCGLGTRAVDRVGSDYPRMVPLGQPTLRPESSVGDIRRSSQRSIDVINLQTNRLESVALADLWGEGPRDPGTPREGTEGPRDQGTEVERASDPSLTLIPGSLDPLIPSSRVPSLGGPQFPWAREEGSGISENSECRIANIECQRGGASPPLHSLFAIRYSQFPWDRIVSVARPGEGGEGLYPPVTTQVGDDPSNLCITFDKLLRSTPFATQVRTMLRQLEAAYGMPVDMEFACDGQTFYVLQCRPQPITPETGAVAVPADILEEALAELRIADRGLRIPPATIRNPKSGVPPGPRNSSRIVFTAGKFVPTGLVEGIEYVVYIDPLAYDAVPTRQRRTDIGRVVGRLNRALPDRRFILIGPGRWGSNDLLLGVPVNYADINHARMLIEVARKKGGPGGGEPGGGDYVPEVSFGTHFFQDLVESGIFYLPLFPDEAGNILNESFLGGSPNALAEVLPDDAEFAEDVRVIHVPRAGLAGGGRAAKSLTVALDGEHDRAMAYLVG